MRAIVEDRISINILRELIISRLCSEFCCQRDTQFTIKREDAEDTFWGGITAETISYFIIRDL